MTEPDSIEKVTVEHLGECVLRIHDALLELGAHRKKHGFFTDEQVDLNGNALIPEWQALPTCFGILAFTVPFGVIAGTDAYTGLLEGPNDGVVLVENTKLEGMADWVTVDRSHTYIMNGEETFDYTLKFLRTGKF